MSQAKSTGPLLQRHSLNCLGRQSVVSRQKRAQFSAKLTGEQMMMGGEALRT